MLRHLMSYRKFHEIQDSKMLKLEYLKKKRAFVGK